VTDDFEILVVNDGSKDSTGAVADRLAAEMPFVRAIHHERNKGYGAARAGALSGLGTAV